MYQEKYILYKRGTCNKKNLLFLGLSFKNFDNIKT